MSGGLLLEQLVIGVDADETYAQRKRREMAESLALDQTALEVGAERNLVYPGSRGERGFPICAEANCRRESCGPFSYGCVAHYEPLLKQTRAAR